tara:strand:- start:5373 stop:6020 length:648 start_codon:yes stop_codon:yes gene_type:complete
MDGNNRWSKKNKLNKYNGYKKGANTLMNLSNFIFKSTDVNYISAFALSKNNLNRSKTLISTLKKILLEFLNKEIEDRNISNFNIRFIGNKSFLTKDIKKKISQLECIKKKSKKYLLIYINYSGREDISKAASNYRIHNKENKKYIKFQEFLLTKDFPDPDILIRTGGYSRLSDFLIYQMTFTELFFYKKLWPDLTKIDLIKIFKKYHSLERKFGL